MGPILRLHAPCKSRWGAIVKALQRWQCKVAAGCDVLCEPFAALRDRIRKACNLTTCCTLPSAVVILVLLCFQSSEVTTRVGNDELSNSEGLLTVQIPLRVSDGLRQVFV